VSDGLGDWVNQGFICQVCQDALDFMLCIKCGRKYRRADMIEWDDKFYCKNCVKVKKPIIRLKPLAKFKGGAMIPRKRAQKRKGIRDVDPGMVQGIERAIKREEEAETAGKFRDITSEIQGDTRKIDEKDKDIDSLQELKELGEKLREAKERKKKKEDEEYSVKGE
jgi:hypothetical protein